jgi:hypothetical protein
MKIRRLTDYERANSLTSCRSASLYQWGFGNVLDGMACRISNGRLVESSAKKKKFLTKYI